MHSSLPSLAGKGSFSQSWWLGGHHDLNILINPMFPRPRTNVCLVHVCQWIDCMNQSYHWCQTFWFIFDFQSGNFDGQNLYFLPKRGLNATSGILGNVCVISIINAISSLNSCQSCVWPRVSRSSGFRRVLYFYTLHSADVTNMYSK